MDAIRRVIVLEHLELEDGTKFVKEMELRAFELDLESDGFNAILNLTGKVEGDAKFLELPRTIRKRPNITVEKHEPPITDGARYYYLRWLEERHLKDSQYAREAFRRWIRELAENV